MRWQHEPLLRLGLSIAILLERVDPDLFLALDDEGKIDAAQRQKIQFMLPSRPVPPSHRVAVRAIVERETKLVRTDDANCFRRGRQPHRQSKLVATIP